MRINTLVSLSGAFLAAVSLPASAQTATPIGGIDGAWSSLSCEVRPQAGPDGAIQPWWLTREISFENSKISAEFTTYADAGCTVPLQVLGFAGDVKDISASNVASGAANATLVISDYVTFKPVAQGFADFLNSAPAGSCGKEAWEVGKTQDVLKSGCALLGIQPGEPTVEYEVLLVEDDHLYFGARPVDGRFLSDPKDRPTALQVPLKRRM